MNRSARVSARRNEKDEEVIYVYIYIYGIFESHNAASHTYSEDIRKK